jgi:hypothetical protein
LRQKHDPSTPGVFAEYGLVSSRTVGRASVYSLAVQPELLGLLAAAERLLAVTGDAVTLCPTYGDHLVSGTVDPSRSIVDSA